MGGAVGGGVARGSGVVRDAGGWVAARVGVGLGRVVALALGVGAAGVSP